jgi:nucleoid DNA-binding protein
MTKAELVAKISKEASITKKKAEMALNSLIEAIGQALKKGDKVRITSLGTFRVKNTKARAGVNPQTQAKIQIPATKAPAFRAAKALKDAVKRTSKKTTIRQSVKIIEIVANYLGLDPVIVAEISKNADRTYRKYQIPKKKGGYRSIFHPSKATKSVQYAIIQTVLRDLQIHDCAVGYIKGLKSPLLQNAKKHSKFRYSVRIDFEDFFPSIRPRDLINILKSTEKFADIDPGDQEFLARSLFVRYSGGNVGLAIGAPSSPSVCNVVLHSLDEKINRLAISTSTDSVYTRSGCKTS